MKYNTFGKTNLEVSEIGFGGWQVSGDWGALPDKPSDVITTAVDSGINLFDSAYVYGDGESERVLGQALKSVRDKVIITSKIPPKNFKWDVKAHHRVSDYFDKQWIIKATERSLKNFDTDYIDIQMLHTWNDSFVEQNEWFEAMEILKQQGKIRFTGASIKSWEFEEGQEGIKAGMLDMIQVLYNIFEQRPNETLIPLAQEHNIGVIARVPYDEGLLTGRYLPGHEFGDGDWRKNWMTEERLAEAAPHIKALEQYLGDDYSSLAEMALKFCTSTPGVGSTIAGARRIQHVESNANTASLPSLSNELIAKLKQHAWPHNWHYDGDDS